MHTLSIIKIMERIITTLVFTVSFLINANSQSDFRNGYIITEKNDTLFGLVNNRGAINNSQKCIYKENKDSEKVEFSPKEIKGYRFTNGKYYISKSINNQDIFLEYIINAIVKIYYYRDSRGDHYILEDENKNLHELNEEEKEVIVGNTKYMQQSKRYIGILKAAFKKSLKTTKKADDIKLNHKSLLKITEEYHNDVCFDKQCIIYEKKIIENKLKFGFLGGVDLLLFRTNKAINNEHYYLQNKEMGVVISPAIGFFLKKKMPSFNEKMNIQYEGVLSKTNFNTTSSYIDDIYNWNHLNEINLTQTSYSNRLVLNYEFPKEKIKPNFQIGGFSNHFFNVNYQRDLEIKFAWGDTHQTASTSESPFNRVDYGLCVGLGLNKIYSKEKEIFLNVRYNRGLGFLKGLNTNYFYLICCIEI